MRPSPADRAICPVICIGAIHLDTIAHAAEVIRPETSTPAAFVSKPGGVATNIARALVRLGVETHLVGTVGDDAAAGELTQGLASEGLKLSHVPHPGYATGQYLALHDPDGTLAAACVDDRILAEAPPDLFDSVLVDLMSVTAPETIWFLDANLPEPMPARIAGKIDRRIADKPGGQRIVANAVSDAKAPRLKPVLPELDCLLLNRGEAVALTGLAQDAAADDLAQALAGTGVRSFVLTSGAADVLVWEAGGLSRFPTQQVAIVDVTGAGDALTAGTLAALARGYPLGQAVPFGLSAAALTLQATGALADDLSWDALKTF